jgi:hypothetical protein
MWKCEVKLSDANGASGDNCKLTRANRNNAASSSTTRKSKDETTKPKTNKGPTPLFRWYRGKLELATLPHILEDIVEVECKMPAKKRWANGMSDDELDSSDEEWDEDNRFIPEPNKKMTMEVSVLTTSAYEDSCHPLPTISRTWISPDLQKFQSRKSAIAHAEVLVERDLLIDRTLYGYGKHGIRLRPVKPTRKAALEAGVARFLRDGVWVVGQEELWIEKRREIYNKKQGMRLARAEYDRKEEDSAAKEEGGACENNADEKFVADSVDDTKSAAKEVPVEDATIIDVKSAAAKEARIENATVTITDAKPAAKDFSAERVESATAVEQPSIDDVGTMSVESKAVVEKTVDNNIVYATNQSECKPATITNTSDATGEDKPHCDDEEKEQSTVTTNESDASTNEETALVKRKPTKRGRDYFEPVAVSTHYRLNPQQIDKCYTACIEHYEKVMVTVKARSLHHELADGFDVFRERGKGRYDMELPAFDTNEYSFLTDQKRAAWMPIIHKLLGEDAQLVHKGCFLSLPGSESQVYHQDGVHLNTRVHKPCHAVNVFIPLIDYDMSRGPTEFCLGTHYLGNENFVKDWVYTPCVAAGTPIIFDYRLG